MEFSLYNINTKLLAVFSFLFEFPVSERAQSSQDLIIITLWPITGLDLQLLLVVPTDNIFHYKQTNQFVECKYIPVYSHLGDATSLVFLFNRWSFLPWCSISWYGGFGVSSEKVPHTCCPPGGSWVSVNWLWQHLYVACIWAGVSRPSGSGPCTSVTHEMPSQTSTPSLNRVRRIQSWRPCYSLYWCSR